jgi:hypothetical protein
MTTRTRQKRRRRKALARWRHGQWIASFIARARRDLDAFMFGRTVVEYGPGRMSRRVPPSEWLFLGTLDEMDDRRAAALRTTVTKIESEDR